MKTIEAIRKWMVTYKKNAVKAATYDRLERSLNQMSSYGIAEIPVEKLRSDDIQRYLNELVDSGYALTTIKKQFHLLTGFMTYANLNGIIVAPIHKGVHLPSQTVVKKQKREVLSYTVPEQVALRRVLYSLEKPAYGVALMMLETGMRIGEALAIEWNDVDWGRRAIRINKTFVLLGNGRERYLQNSAKSFTSNRTIPLSTEAYKILQRLAETERELDGFIFHDRNGNPLSYESMRYQIRMACDAAGVPYYGQHAFRHTFATNCYNRGCDVKILSKLLGHSDVTITYNVYIHLFGDALEEMRKVLV